MNEFTQIENLIYKEKKYDEALEKIKSSSFVNTKSYKKLLADTFFFKDDFITSSKIYNEIEEFYQAGYCYFLLNQIDLAIEFFIKAEESPARNWNLFFAETFRARVNLKPTYLQVRAFLEKDMDLFLRLDLTLYVQQIIDISDYLFSVNPETNKFIARAFLNNDYPEYAKEYLDRAFDFTMKDAELYYLQAKYYKTQGLEDKVKENLRESLHLSDNFVPAKLMLQEIN